MLSMRTSSRQPLQKKKKKARTWMKLIERNSQKPNSGGLPAQNEDFSDLSFLPNSDRRLIGPTRDFYSGERLQEFITRAGHRDREKTQQPQKARGPGAALQTRRRERGRRLRSGAFESRGRDDEPWHPRSRAGVTHSIDRGQNRGLTRRYDDEFYWHAQVPAQWGRGGDRGCRAG